MNSALTVYVVCMDPLRPKEKEAFDDFLNHQPFIADWLNEISGCYYLRSSLPEVELTDLLQDGFPTTRPFLISRLDHNFNGLLSEESWLFLRGLQESKNLT